MFTWRAFRNALPALPSNAGLALKVAFWPLAVATTINDNVLEITPINGPSMSPTLSRDYHETGRRDYMAWSKWQPTEDLQRGDVVLYHNPRSPESSAVKRVIALGGDTVILDRRRRPGHNDMGQVNPLEITAMRNWDALGGRITVPYGHVWVEGDNWRKSFDSNHVGPISRSMIVGKAATVVLPLRRAGLKPWEMMYHGRTKVLKGSESPPEEWRDLVESTAIG